MVKLIPIMLACQGPIIKAEEGCSLVSTESFKEQKGRVLQAHLLKTDAAWWDVVNRPACLSDELVVQL